MTKLLCLQLLMVGRVEALFKGWFNEGATLSALSAGGNVVRCLCILFYVMVLPDMCMGGGVIANLKGA